MYVEHNVVSNLANLSTIAKFVDVICVKIWFDCLRLCFGLCLHSIQTIEPNFDTNNVNKFGNCGQIGYNVMFNVHFT